MSRRLLALVVLALIAVSACGSDELVTSSEDPAPAVESTADVEKVDETVPPDTTAATAATDDEDVSEALKGTDWAVVELIDFPDSAQLPSSMSTIGPTVRFLWDPAFEQYAVAIANGCSDGGAVVRWDGPTYTPGEAEPDDPSYDSNTMACEDPVPEELFAFFDARERTVRGSDGSTAQLTSVDTQFGTDGSTLTLRRGPWSVLLERQG